MADKPANKDVQAGKIAQLKTAKSNLKKLNEEIESSESLCGTTLAKKRNLESRIESLESELKKK